MDVIFLYILPNGTLLMSETGTVAEPAVADIDKRLQKMMPQIMRILMLWIKKFKLDLIEYFTK